MGAPLPAAAARLSGPLGDSRRGRTERRRAALRRRQSEQNSDKVKPSLNTAQ